MLNIIAAFMFAFLEFRKRLILWISVGLIYLALDSLLPAKNRYLSHLYLMLFIFLQVGVANLSILALNNKKYEIKNLFTKPSTFFRVFIIMLIQFVLFLPIVLLLMIGMSHPLLKDITYFTTFPTPLIIGAYAIIFIINAKCLLSPFYLLDKNTSIIESVKQSWKQCSIKVAASFILYFIGIAIINAPYYMLENKLKEYNLYFYALAFIQAIYILALAHLYMQIKRRNEKEITVGNDVTRVY